MDFAYYQYVCTSYREDYCTRDSRRFGSLVSSEWYQLRWGDRVNIIRKSDSHVENARGGWRTPVPFKSLTGGRGDRLIIDDPHSIDTAESDAEREQTTIRFRDSATTRMNDPIRSAILVTMQRLHDLDISGVILRLKMPYVLIMLPMRFEPERCCITPIGKDPRTIEGELLWPERFPLSVVERDESAMLASSVSGQMQQRPSPRGGLMFKKHWFAIVGAAPGDCRLVRGWDIAASDSLGSAFTCGVMMGYCARLRHYFVIDVVRDRTTNPELMITNTAAQDETKYGGKHLFEIDMPQDPGAAGKILAKSFVGALPGFRAYATPETGDKITRAEPFAIQAQAANVSLVKAPWNDAYLEEIGLFPAAAFKDQVDASSRAFGRFVMAPAAQIAAPIIVTAPMQIIGDNNG